MLVLSRKLNESIVINDKIVVTVRASKAIRYDSASMPRWKSPFIARKCTRRCEAKKF